MGILSLMYHRFDEKKYPSTNIEMTIFKEQIKIIRNLNYNFYNPGELDTNFYIEKKEKKILITIDDAFSSFYEVAWPYLKKRKNPFYSFCFYKPYWEKRVYVLEANKRSRKRIKCLYW